MTDEILSLFLGGPRQPYKIQSQTCRMGSRSGVCMFVWECIKTEGIHLGMCVDGFMFGSCCAHSSSNPLSDITLHSLDSKSAASTSSNSLMSPKQQKPTSKGGIVWTQPAAVTDPPTSSSPHWTRRPPEAVTNPSVHVSSKPSPLPLLSFPITATSHLSNVIGHLHGSKNKKPQVPLAPTGNDIFDAFDALYKPTKHHALDPLNHKEYLHLPNSVGIRPTKRPSYSSVNIITAPRPKPRPFPTTTTPSSNSIQDVISALPTHFTIVTRRPPYRPNSVHIITAPRPSPTPATSFFRPKPTTTTTTTTTTRRPTTTKAPPPDSTTIVTVAADKDKNFRGEQHHFVNFYSRLRE